MANGLHEVGMRVEEKQPFSSAVERKTSERNEQFPRKGAVPGKETRA